MRKSQARSFRGDRITPGSLNRALAVIGDSWALLILKEAFLGTRRFQDFQSRLGISRQTLMLRLNHLTEHAIFYKSRAQYEKVVFEYRLTPKGADLYPFILMVWRLHRRWRLGGSILPAKLYHRLCGHSLEVHLYCGACKEALDAEIQFEPGPGQAEAMTESRRKTRIVNDLEALGPNFLASVVLGDGWCVLVLNAILRGLEHFEEIQEALQISSNVLSFRLKTLLSLELLTQEQSDQDKRKLRYQATRKGRDVFPMIISLIQWGDRWLAGSTGPPDLLTHVKCGRILEPVIFCNHCWIQLRLDDVSAKPDLPGGA